MAEAIPLLVTLSPEPPAEGPGAAAPAAVGADGVTSFPGALAQALDKSRLPGAATDDRSLSELAAELTDGGKNLPVAAVLAALMTGTVPAAPGAETARNASENGELLGPDLPPQGGPIPGPIPGLLLGESSDSGIGAENARLARAAPLAAGLTSERNLPAPAENPELTALPLAGNESETTAAATPLPESSTLIKFAADPASSAGFPSETLAGLSRLAAPGATGAPSAGGASTTLALPVDHPQWGSELGNRVQWLVNRQTTGAELRLSPPELGPLSVQINIEQDQASISFNAPQAVVREAIENALPRLREMLAGNGINLLEVNVSSRGFDQAQRDPAPGDAWPASRGDALDDPAATVTHRLLGLVDLYA